MIAIFNMYSLIIWLLLIGEINATDDLSECTENGFICPSNCIAGETESLNTSNVCNCSMGYQYVSENNRCVDINECMVSNICSYKCLNLPGSYICECPTNSVIDPSNSTNCVATYDVNSTTISNYADNLQDFNTNYTIVQNITTIDIHQNDTNYFDTTYLPLENNETIIESENSVKTTSDDNESDLQQKLTTIYNQLLENNTEYYPFPDNTDPSTFICNDGYYKSLVDYICVKIMDECYNHSYACKHKCNEKINEPSCYCPTNYTHNGEIGVCIKDYCALKNTCPVICTSSYIGPQCSCSSGFKSVLNATCTDINECMERNSCSLDLACVNTIGSYKCIPKNFEIFENIDDNWCKEVSLDISISGYTLPITLNTQYGAFSSIKFCPHGKIAFGKHPSCQTDGNSINLFLLNRKLTPLKDSKNTRSGYFNCEIPNTQINDIFNLSLDVRSMSNAFIWKNLLIKDSFYSIEQKSVSFAMVIFNDNFSTKFSVFYGQGINSTTDQHKSDILTGYLKVNSSTMVKIINNTCDYCENPMISLGTLSTDHPNHECINWTINQPLFSYKEIINVQNISCPTDLSQANNDFTFKFIHPLNFLQDSSERTCLIKQFILSQLVATLQCCYFVSNGKFINSKNSHFVASKYPKSLLHLAYYSEQKNWLQINNKRYEITTKCCNLKNTESCRLVYSVQIFIGNVGYLKPARSLTYGDPHFITIDGIEFTFNGLGNFIAIQSTNTWPGQPFRVDYRLERMVRVDDDTILSNATVISAVGLLLNGTTTLFSQSDTIELYCKVNNETKTSYIKLLINGNEYDWGSFTQKSVNNYNILKITENSEYNNTKNSLLVLNFDGNGMFVEIFPKYLIVNLIVSRNFYGFNEGLLGKVDNVASNDFTSRENIQVLVSSDEQTIFTSFAVTWRESNTLLQLPPDGYLDPIWIPNFSDQFDINTMDLNLYQQALIICRNVTNIQCFYDISQTGDIDIVVNSENSIKILQHVKNVFKNDPPIIIDISDDSNNTIDYIELTDGMTFYGKINLAQYNSIIFQSNYEEIIFYNEGYIIWTINLTQIYESLEIIVSDQFNKTTSIFIPLFICNCSNDQICHQGAFYAQEIYPNVYKRKCKCSIEFTGENCEFSQDPCKTTANTCFEPLSCIFTNNTIVCDQCAEGYIGDGHICLQQSICNSNSPTCSSSSHTALGLSVGLSVGIVGFACIAIGTFFLIKQLYYKVHKIPKRNDIQLTVKT